MESTKDIKKKYIKIYPTYIDKGIKYSEGRKIASGIAVENPHIREIAAVCAEMLGLEVKLEVVIILHIFMIASPSQRLVKKRKSTSPS
jgi:signal recognition particle subunit SEC65